MRKLQLEFEVPKSWRWFVAGDLKFQDRWPDWVWDHLWPERLVQRALCLAGGHVPIPDQCGKPEHDYCAWCHVSTPGQADRPRESDDLRPLTYVPYDQDDEVWGDDWETTNMAAEEE